MAGQKELARKTWKLFGQMYPAFRKILPLKIGVAEDLIARHPDIPLQLLVAVLRIHCGSPYYHKAISLGGPRYDLEGMVCGEVADEARADAALKFKNWVKRKEDGRAQRARKLEKARARLEREKLALQAPTPRKQVQPNTRVDPAEKCLAMPSSTITSNSLPGRKHRKIGSW